MRFVNKLLNKLARRIVKNAPHCTLWRLAPVGTSFLGTGTRLRAIPTRGFEWVFAGGLIRISTQMQRAFPLGGWSWRVIGRNN